MTRDSEILDEVLGRLAPLGARSRAMFGGFGVYVDGVMMGLVSGGIVYFKTDATNRGDYEVRGTGPFTYTGKRGQPVAMSYYEVPDDVFDDVDELVAWAETALAVAKRNRKPKRTGNPGRRAVRSALS